MVTAGPKRWAEPLPSGPGGKRPHRPVQITTVDDPLYKDTGFGRPRGIKAPHLRRGEASEDHAIVADTQTQPRSMARQGLHVQIRRYRLGGELAIEGFFQAIEITAVAHAAEIPDGG